MSFTEAKEKYAVIGIDAQAAIDRLKSVPVSMHCWQGDDVRGFDTDPTKPLTGGIQTTGNYPGRARTPEELMADIDLSAHYWTPIGYGTLEQGIMNGKPFSGNFYGNGHVIKGRKMAGQWGAETVTQPSAVVVDVRPEDNVIIVKGAVPGPKNGLVLIRKQ